MLLKAEEPMFKSGGVMTIRHILLLRMGLRMIIVKVFNDMETAFVYIEMDVAFFKIGSTGFPYQCVRMHLLNGIPYSKTDPAALRAMLYI